VPLSLLKRGARFVTADGGSVKARVLRSGFWVGLSSVGLTVLNFVRSVALARLLTPEVFGLMGLASVVMRMAETFTRPGVAQALIARQRDFDSASGTAFSILAARGFLLAAVNALAAIWIAEFYEEPQLEPILQVLSGVFIVTGFANINTIASQRELDFRKLTYLTQATNVAGMVLTIGAAWWLRSVWALVIGQLAQAALNTVLSYYFIPGRMVFQFDRAVARELMSYSKFVTSGSIVTFMAAQLDIAVVGKLLGAESLGFYNLATTISSLVSLSLARLASGIMMPAYSKLQNEPAALRAAYLRVLSLVMVVVLPATVGLIVAADSLVHVVYGAKWAAATLPLQVLAVFGIFRALFVFAGYLFEGVNQPKVAFHLGVWRLAVVAVLIFPFLRLYGLAGVALAVTVAGVVQWGGGLYYLRKLVGLQPGEMLRITWRPIWTSVVMAAVVLGVQRLVEPRSIGGLMAMVGAGVAVYAVLNLKTIKELKRQRI
jgi:O-antigen/teichoic acid export membrane protein